MFGNTLNAIFAQISRSSSPEVFYEKVFLKFHKIHMKTPVLESLFNKVAVLLNSDSGTIAFLWILQKF